ncbi:MAG: S8 family serine peptidase [Gammaproteobacteria bacterium]
MAPKADLYAVRVFGCEGSTNVVVDAIDWAIAHDMDVINMSLGSDYGSADDADAVEVDNAARAGVVVISSAGNAGPAPYITERRRRPTRRCRSLRSTRIRVSPVRRSR